MGFLVPRARGSYVFAARRQGGKTGVLLPQLGQEGTN
jgi:hypothetical protein